MRVLIETYRYQVFASVLICTEYAESDENHVNKVDDNWRPHVTEEIDDLPLDDGELERGGGGEEH